MKEHQSGLLPTATGFVIKKERKLPLDLITAIQIQIEVCPSNNQRVSFGRSRMSQQFFIPFIVLNLKKRAISILSKIVSHKSNTDAQVVIALD